MTTRTIPHRTPAVFALATALVMAVLAVAAVVASPKAASAAPPDPVDETTVVRGECGFPVLLEMRGKEKVVELPGGRTLITSPGLRATLTNLEEQSNRVTLSITGTVHVKELANGDVVYVFRGRNLFWGPDTDFILTIGRFTGRVTAAGEFSPITGKGRVIDVCARLA
jgi:hypothetical protein